MVTRPEEMKSVLTVRQERKFKKCECYERYKTDPFITGGSQAKYLRFG